MLCSALIPDEWLYNKAARYNDPCLPKLLEFGPCRSSAGQTPTAQGTFGEASVVGERSHQAVADSSGRTSLLFGRDDMA
jgi:hypothetical protein